MRHICALTVSLLLILGNRIPSLSQAPPKKEKNFSITPLPVIYYAPETRLGLGAAAALVFRFNKWDTLSRKSNIQPYFIYTINRQILSSIGYTLFFNKEKYRTEGEVAYYYFPEFYYGIGNNLPAENQELVSYRWFRVYNKTARLIREGLFAGLAYEYVNMYRVERVPGGLLETTHPTGYDGSVVSGIGPAITYDTRDNVLNATKGWYADFSALFYGNATGSSNEFEKIKIDVRKFHTLWPKLHHVLAFQAVGTFVPGDAPYKHLAQLGGDVIMRGYYSGRYRDRYLIAIQAEYRIPIWRFIGAVAFVGAGSVADNMGQFGSNRVWPSYGAGLRIKVSKKDNINIRLDYGWGNGSEGLYINIAEAF